MNKKNKYSLSNNDYLITPFKEDDRIYTISDLLIASLVNFVSKNNEGAKIRRLNILSCYSDGDVSFYEYFFSELFKVFSENSKLKMPLTHVRVVFDKIDFSNEDYNRLKLFLGSINFCGCKFEIRTSSGGSLLHAKTVLLEIGGEGNKGLLICTSANFTRNGYSGKNREFILQSNSIKSIIASKGEFEYLWHIGSMTPSFSDDLNPKEPTSLYLLKGFFLINRNDNKLPLSNKIEIKFKESANSRTIQPFLEKLLLKESSNSKSVSFELVLLEAFFGKDLREVVTKLSNRHNFRVICSKYLDTYWIMPETYRILCQKNNNPFQVELKFYSDVVQSLKLALEDEEYTLQKFKEIVTEELFKSLEVDLNRNDFIIAIIQNVKSVLNAYTELTVWELFGLNPIPSHLANHRGEVDRDTIKALSEGFLLDFRSDFEKLPSTQGTINTSQSELLNMRLFDRLNEKRKESIEIIEKLSSHLFGNIDTVE
jgi:hypothetical protein